jgi:hypothetical protein
VRLVALPRIGYNAMSFEREPAGSARWGASP